MRGGTPYETSRQTDLLQSADVECSQLGPGGVRKEQGHLQHFPDILRAIQDLAGPGDPSPDLSTV